MTIEKPLDLVLIGGGHSHAIALKLWAMNPLPDVRFILISDTSHTPYSGMLPGHVAGFYNYDETHIDLRCLADFAKAQFYLDRAMGLDLENNQVICENHPPVIFDYLSIDIGSIPSNIEVLGAKEYTIPAKPVPQFLQAWNNIIDQVKTYPEKPLILSIVGGGAGGVELALNMQARLEKILKDAQQPLENLTIHLFHKNKSLLTGHNAWIRNRFKQILASRGIQVHLQQSVIEVIKQPNNFYQIICQSGFKITANHIFWVTQASAPNWIKASGLKTDSKGFILVSNTLQSLSHPQIFAAGDIATIQNYSCPKAGVFAVRQGRPLWENLQRIILGKPLKKYWPQKHYLSLIGTGDKKAIASWAFLGLELPLLWVWKDHIDQQFMENFRNLSTMPSSQASLDMRCSGCGSKVSNIILERVLSKLEITSPQDIIIGLNTPDDAAVFQVPSEQLMVQTVDFFSSLINDPFLFGQIVTHHCLSDLFAMGAKPQSALAIVTIPYGLEAKIADTLYQILSGAIKVLKKSQASLIGGHTTEGLELAFGLSCNGLVAADKILKKGGMQPGDILILTKALGIGTIFAAKMKYKAKGSWIDSAIESMLLSNQEAAKIFLENGATACTDITGFGLLGHLIEMIKASQVSVKLDLENIPILAGAIEMSQQGIMSSLYPHNLKAANYIHNPSKVINLPKYSPLFDPQTSGGLLASIPAEKAEACLKSLQNSGYNSSCLIGQVVPQTERNFIYL